MYLQYLLTSHINILQKGLQPIHYAAQEGHEDIVMMLVNDFNIEPNVVNFVCKCICMLS